MGPTQISYLLKYDRGRGNYDRQYIISQVVGCLEPYVLYRKFPDDYKIGVRLRIDRFLRMLSSREFKRRRPAQPVESKTSAPIPSSPSG